MKSLSNMEPVRKRGRCREEAQLDAGGERRISWVAVLAQLCVQVRFVHLKAVPFMEQISPNLCLLSTWGGGWGEAVLSQITTFQINRTHPWVAQTEDMSTNPQIITSINVLFPARAFNKDSPALFFSFQTGSITISLSVRITGQRYGA